jgi:hypothetical protein
MTRMSPEDLAAEIRQLCGRALTFRICHVRQSLIQAAERALEVDDPERRELAERLLREVRKIPVSDAARPVGTAEDC